MKNNTISAGEAMEHLFSLCEQTEKIETTLTETAFEAFDKNEWCENGQELLRDAYEEAVDMVNRMRQLIVQRLDNKKITPLLVNFQDVRKLVKGIEIAEKDGVYRITLPVLIPRRVNLENGEFYNKNAHYLDSLLWFSLDDLFYRCQLERIENAAVLFLHEYVRKPNGKILIRDNDNYEEKYCIDRIANYLIKSDSGLSCSIHKMARIGSATRTVIYVMPEDTARRHLYDVLDWEYADCAE